MSVDGNVRILRTNTPGASFSSLAPGQIAINQHDGVLFWPDPSGVTQSANLLDILNIPGLLAVMSVVHVGFVASTQSYTFDVRTKHALLLLFGGSGGAPNGAGLTGGNGGATSFGPATAAGGGGGSISGDGSTFTPGADGGGSLSGGTSGLVLIGLGAKAPYVAGSPGGNGGLVVAWWSTPTNGTVTIGAAGAGAGGPAGRAGSVLIVELT